MRERPEHVCAKTSIDPFPMANPCRDKGSIPGVAPQPKPTPLRTPIGGAGLGSFLTGALCEIQYGWRSVDAVALPVEPERACCGASR